MYNWENLWDRVLNWNTKQTADFLYHDMADNTVALWCICGRNAKSNEESCLILMKLIEMNIILHKKDDEVQNELEIGLVVRNHSTDDNQNKSLWHDNELPPVKLKELIWKGNWLYRTPLVFHESKTNLLQKKKQRKERGKKKKRKL